MTRDQAVADMGCGPGFVTDYLSSLGLAVVGYDLSPELTARGRELFPDLDLRFGDITLPAPSERRPIVWPAPITLDRMTSDTTTEMSTEEWEVRCELAAAYRMFAHWGWDDLIYTHLSARVPGPDHHFLLNPLELGFDEITASSLVKVDSDGEAVDPTEFTTNPAGFVIHSAVHFGREDAMCVMHLHTPDGQAVSAQSEGLLPLAQTSMLALGFGVGYHDFEGPATDLDERERLVQDLGDNGLLLLRNHGTLSVGSTVGEAFTRLYYLERSCEIQVRAGLGSAKLTEPSITMVERSGELARGLLTELNVGKAWPMIVRRANRLFPDLSD